MVWNQPTQEAGDAQPSPSQQTPRYRPELSSGTLLADAPKPASVSSASESLSAVPAVQNDVVNSLFPGPFNENFSLVGHGIAGPASLSGGAPEIQTGGQPGDPTGGGTTSAGRSAVTALEQLLSSVSKVSEAGSIATSPMQASSGCAAGIENLPPGKAGLLQGQINWTSQDLQYLGQDAQTFAGDALGGMGTAAPSLMLQQDLQNVGCDFRSISASASADGLDPSGTLSEQLQQSYRGLQQSIDTLLAVGSANGGCGAVGNGTGCGAIASLHSGGSGFGCGACGNMTGNGDCGSVGNTGNSNLAPAAPYADQTLNQIAGSNPELAQILNDMANAGMNSRDFSLLENTVLSDVQSGQFNGQSDQALLQGAIGQLQGQFVGGNSAALAQQLTAQDILTLGNGTVNPIAAGGCGFTFAGSSGCGALSNPIAGSSGCGALSNPIAGSSGCGALSNPIAGSSGCGALSNPIAGSSGCGALSNPIAGSSGCGALSNPIAGSSGCGALSNPIAGSSGCGAIASVGNGTVPQGDGQFFQGEPNGPSVYSGPNQSDGPFAGTNAGARTGPLDQVTAAPSPMGPPQPGMVLTFNDNFSSGASDVSGDAAASGGQANWTNHIWYNGTPTNYSIQNGVLDISGNNGGGGCGLSTINSNGQGFTQKYGFFEASIYQPSASNWDGFWMMSSAHAQNVPGAAASEIDIMEQNPSWGNADSSGYYATVHENSGTGNTWQNNNNFVPAPNVNISAGWHTYAADWTPQGVTFYLDGKPVEQVSSAQFPSLNSSPMFMMLSNGGGSGDMLVSNVRAYQYPQYVNDPADSAPGASTG